MSEQRFEDGVYFLTRREFERLFGKDALVEHDAFELECAAAKALGGSEAVFGVIKGYLAQHVEHLSRGSRT